MADAKDTIYVDVDDDITGIIEKVSGSKHKIVALVLPKRAAVLQSIVNMKLLKRSSDSQKKSLVLITSESSILPLAGAVKIHVAKTLQSKPSIPSAPKVSEEDLAVDDDEEAEEEVEDEPAIDKSKPIGELAGAKAVEETIDLDNTEDVSAADEKPSKLKGFKTPKIPNFDKFRKKTLLIGGGVFLLVVFWILGTFVLPKAKITIKTDNISVDTQFSFTANTKQTDLNVDKGLIPAVDKTVKKTDTEKVPATGSKNAGEKATGTVTLKLANCAKNDANIPAGTTVTNGSLNFVTLSDVKLITFEKTIHCFNDSQPAFTSKTVKVTAPEGGAKYNISGGRAFSVAGFSEVSGVDSSEIKGGTDKVVTVVAEKDIETAKQKLTDRSKDAASDELKKQLDEAQLFAIVESLAGDAPEITSTPKVGDESSDVQVISSVTYHMLGVKNDDLKNLVENAAKKQTDLSKQKIADDGLSKATIKISDRKSNTEQVISLSTTVSTGAQIDKEQLKKDLSGKKKGDIREQLKANYPGYKDADVSLSPFWLIKTPKATRLTIIIESANGNAN